MQEKNPVSANYFASNLKLLRKRRGRTQDDVAFVLNMKRSTLSGYENQVAQPGIDALLTFSEYFNVSVDTLIRENLAKLPESRLRQLELGNDAFVKGSRLRVLTSMLSSTNEETIELVGEKAKAGYCTGFADPEYISILPAFSLPFLSKQKKYRSFEISGDSMLPIPDGSIVTGEFVQNWESMRSGIPYVVLTLDEGIVFKVVENHLKSRGTLKLISLNPLYEPYEIHVNTVREVWKFVNFISSRIPEANTLRDKLEESVLNLQKQVKAIQMRLDF